MEYIEKYIKDIDSKIIGMNYDSVAELIKDNYSYKLDNIFTLDGTCGTNNMTIHLYTYNNYNKICENRFLVFFDGTLRQIKHCIL